MALNLDCVGQERGPYTFEYSDKEVILYALGVGAGTDELQYTFEGHPRFHVLPTFAVIPATAALFDGITLLGADLTRLLHGEQHMRFHEPMPTAGRVLTKYWVAAVYDKGKGALAIVEALTTDADERPLAENAFHLYIRGEGGFGGESGPRSEKLEYPGSKPSYQVQQTIMEHQALLYRLNGDRNPLHASPEFARAAGFEKPILHGLCTLGFAVRHVIGAGLKGEGSRLKALRARFSAVVYPGDTLMTEGWKTDGGTRHLVRVSTQRSAGVITNFVVETG